MPALRHFALLTVLFLSLAAAAGAAAHSFSSVVSFGDSLSDTTNNPALGDYWDGRWSNGPLWDEYLAGALGATLHDYAFSGSETIALSNQVAAASSVTWNSTNTLFTVWSGANDFIDNAETNGLNDAAWEATASAAVSNIAQAVSMLCRGGARYVMVLNLPDLSQLPALETNAEFAAERSDIHFLATEFNNELNDALGQVEGANPDLRLAVVDDFTLLDGIIMNPSADGFTVVTNDALDALGDPSFDGPGADYLFWDVIHPTTKAHQLLAQTAQGALAQFPPSLLAGPSNQTVAVGAEVTFTADALDASSYQWYFGRHKIAGATIASYVIASATDADAGLYSVEAINPSGTVTSADASLAVKVAPRIVLQPRSENGILGHTLTLIASASGSAPLAYQWQVDGMDSMNATRKILVLTNLQTNASGSYVFIAANTVGSATSHVAVLNVLVPPSITSPPASAEAVAGTSVTFSVVAAGTAPLRYQWLRDGASLPRQTNASLTLPAVTLAQAGRFQVLVKNQGGSALSAAAILKVEKSAAP